MRFKGGVRVTTFGFGLPVSGVVSEGVLEGPEISFAKSAHLEALDGKAVSGNGLSFAVINGAVFFGELNIGEFSDPDAHYQVEGLSVGWEGFRGALSIDKDSFDVFSIKN